jgi:tyrosinase
MPDIRTRYSIQYLQEQYYKGNKGPLDKVVRAFAGIQANPPTKNPDSPDTNSFFDIAGYHGEPFRGEDAVTAKDSNYWGGYCNHGNVLFPTWHRAYLYRLEEALRSVKGCEDVALPYWDECYYLKTEYSKRPIPSVLTQLEFELDGKKIRNPLRSYTLQKQLNDEPVGDKGSYAKRVGYETVRYPFSGIIESLSGEAKVEAESWNARFALAPEEAVGWLNENVDAWLFGDVKLGKRPPSAILMDYVDVLEAPNYTAFSNTTSAGTWNKDASHRYYVVPLEQPHNDMHLAVGGFYQPGPGGGDADPGPYKIPNGDMGENNTAAFDPIFFLHHCFVDYVFWKWQEKNGFTARGSLEVIRGYDGTVAGEADVNWLPYEKTGTALDMSTELIPFRNKEKTRYINSEDVTNITELGYAYGPGSLDPDKIALKEKVLQNIHSRVRVHNVNRGEISGSFVIRIHAKTRSGRLIEVGRKGVLSRWNVANCANCQTHLETDAIFPISHELATILREGGEDKDVKYIAQLHTHRGLVFGNPDTNEGPQIEHLPART